MRERGMQRKRRGKSAREQGESESESARESESESARERETCAQPKLGVGLSDPHAKLFGCAEPQRREGRDGLGAGGWDAQLLYELEGDICAHTLNQGTTLKLS
jgi:hypothetical protein